MRKRPFKQRAKCRYFLINVEYYGKHLEVVKIENALLSIPRGHIVKTVEQVENLLLGELGGGNVLKLDVKQLNTVYEVRE